MIWGKFLPGELQLQLFYSGYWAGAYGFMAVQTGIDDIPVLLKLIGRCGFIHIIHGNQIVHGKFFKIRRGYFIRERCTGSQNPGIVKIKIWLFPFFDPVLNF